MRLPVPGDEPWRCQGCYTDLCDATFCLRLYQDMKENDPNMNEDDVRRLIVEEMSKRPGPRLPEPLERRMRAAEMADEETRFEARVRTVVIKVLREMNELYKESQP